MNCKLSEIIVQMNSRNDLSNEKVTYSTFPERFDKSVTPCYTFTCIETHSFNLFMEQLSQPVLIYLPYSVWRRVIL